MSKVNKVELLHVGELRRYIHQLLIRKASRKGNIVFVNGVYITSDYDYDTNILTFGLRYVITNIVGGKESYVIEDELYAVKFRTDYSEVEYGKFGELLQSIKIKGNTKEGYYTYQVDERYFNLLRDYYKLFYTEPYDITDTMFDVFRKTLFVDGVVIDNKFFVSDLSENTSAELFTAEYKQDKDINKLTIKMYTKDNRILEIINDKGRVSKNISGYKRLPNGVKHVRGMIEDRNRFGKDILTGLDLDHRENFILGKYFYEIEKMNNKNKDSELEEYRKKVDSVKIMEDSDRGLFTVSYLNGGVDFNDDKVRKARGLTYDKEGNVVIRGFDKFFNYKQLEGRDDYSEEFKEKYTHIEVINENEKLEVDEKLDGTLILLSEYNGELVASTTSTTKTPYSKEAEEYFNGLSSKEYLLSILKDKTLALEYISPTNQIVVEYDEEEYVILSLINNLTGKEYSKSILNRISKVIGCRVYETYYLSLRELLEIQKEDRNLEGFVVRNKHGKRVKFKLDSWFNKSKTNSIFFGNKITYGKLEEILKHYINDTIDDLIAFENQNKVHKKNGLLRKVLGKLEEYLEESYKVYDKYENGEIDRKGISQYDGVIASLVFSKITYGEYLRESMVHSIKKRIYKDLQK